MDSIVSMAEVMSSLFTTTYCVNTSLTILFYDWLLCLDQEIACVWKAGGLLNAASLVYALSRFPLMLGMVFSTATIFPLSVPASRVPAIHMILTTMKYSCHFVFWADNFTILLSRFAIGMFSAFRVYAVSGRKVIPTLIVSFLSTVPIINSLILYIGFTTVEVLPSPLNCSGDVRLSSEWSFRVAVITRSSLIAAETIVIFTTWRNTYRVRRLERDHHLGKTLGSVLLRDGSLYFIILALLNVLQVVLTAVSLDSITSKASYVTIFTDPISSILTSRFILNLRQVDQNGAPSTLPSGGDVQFATQVSRSVLPRFVASFGEPLHTATAGSEVSDEVGNEGKDSSSVDGSSGTRDEVDTGST